MSEPKCTSGPWVTEQITNWNPPAFGVYSSDKTGSIIAQVGGFEFAPRSLEETQANAYLLGAAPELYAALERLVEASYQAAIASQSEAMSVRMARIHATAALAMARGEA